MLWGANAVTSEAKAQTDTITAEMEVVKPIDFEMSCPEGADRQSAMGVLSVDGGGVRGIIPAYILAYLEARSGQRANQLFETMAGTSTGGLIAASLSGPLKDDPSGSQALKLVDHFYTQSADIFDDKFWRNVTTIWGVFGAKFDHQPLQRILRDRFGEQPLSASHVRLVIPTFDLLSNRTILFDSHVAQQSESEDYYLWEVVRAATAAPTIFDAHPMKSLDGKTEILGIDAGLFENSPETIALSAVGDLIATHDVVLLSLGTGIHSEPIVDTDSSVGFWGWIPAQHVLGAYGEASLAEILSRSPYLADRQQDFHHYRLNATIEDSGVAFDGSPENMEILLAHARQLVDDNRNLLDDVILKLACP